MTRKTFIKSEHGQAIVEIAMVLVIFLFTIFGVTEFSRVMYTYGTLVQSTRAAARWAVVNNSTDLDKAKNIAVYGDPNTLSGKALLSGLTPSNVSVSIENIEVDSNNVPITQKISVRITGYQFRFLVPLVPNITIPALETSLYAESMGATS